MAKSPIFYKYTKVFGDFYKKLLFLWSFWIFLQKNHGLDFFHYNIKYEPN